VIATLIKNRKLAGISPHIWLTTTLTNLANGHAAFGSMRSGHTPTLPENAGYERGVKDRSCDGGHSDLSNGKQHRKTLAHFFVVMAVKD